MSDLNNNAFGGIGLGLLRFCLQHSDGNTAETDISQYDREPADYVWLKEALNNLESDSQKMKKLLEKLSDNHITTEQMVYVLEGVQYFIEDLDLANDLVKLDLQHLVNLVNHENADVRRWSAWTFASAAQNNPKTQLALITKYNLLSLLSRAIVVELDEQTKDKQLYALSALTSGSPALMNDFIHNYHGLTILTRLIKTSQLSTTQFKSVWFLKKLILHQKQNRDGQTQSASSPSPAPPTLNLLNNSSLLPDLINMFSNSTKVQTLQVVTELLMELVKDDNSLSHQCKCLGLDKILMNLVNIHEDEELKITCKHLLTFILEQ